MIRVRAGISYALAKAMDEGHCGLPTEELVHLAEKLDRTHGQQFRAKFLKTSAPTTVDGIERYLASGMVRGIGPAPSPARTKPAVARIVMNRRRDTEVQQPESTAKG